MSKENMRNFQFHFGKFKYSYDYKTKKHQAIKFNENLPIKKQPPVFLQFAITNNCNLRCSYCYANSSPQKDGKWDLNSAFNFLKQASESGVTAVAFGGGEPFVLEWFLPLLKMVRKYLPMEISVTTNATLINTEIANDLKSLNIEIRVSINTSLEFIQRKKGLETLTNNHLIPGINSMAVQENNDLFDSTIPYLIKNESVSDLLLLESQSVGRGGLTPLSDKEIIQRVQGLNQTQGDFSIKISSSKSHLFIGDPNISYTFPPQLTQSQGFFVSVSYNKTLIHSSFCDEACEVVIGDNFMNSWKLLSKLKCKRAL